MAAVVRGHLCRGAGHKPTWVQGTVNVTPALAVVRIGGPWGDGGDAGEGCVPGPALSQDQLPAERLHPDAAMLAGGWGRRCICIKWEFKDLR